MDWREISPTRLETIFKDRWVVVEQGPDKYWDWFIFDDKKRILASGLSRIKKLACETAIKTVV